MEFLKKARSFHFSKFSKILFSENFENPIWRRNKNAKPKLNATAAANFKRSSKTQRHNALHFSRRTNSNTQTESTTSDFFPNRKIKFKASRAFCAANFKRSYFFLLLISCVAFGCQSSNIEQEIERDFSSVNLEWIPIENESEISVAEYSEKKLLIHCVRINLHSEKLRIKMLPQGEAQKGVFAKKFARKNSLAVAFNTTPFTARGNIFPSHQIAAGICINSGTRISEPLSSYCALAFFKDDSSEKKQGGFTARIFSTQGTPEINEAEFASGGFWQILKDGKILQFEKIRDSRTFCGIDKEGKTLYVFAAEGENKSRSSGMTYMECAEFARAIGISDAMEFDGGASTQLAVQGKSLLTYANKVKVPALLGFYFAE